MFFNSELIQVLHLTIEVSKVRSYVQLTSQTDTIHWSQSHSCQWCSVLCFSSGVLGEQEVSSCLFVAGPPLPASSAGPRRMEWTCVWSLKMGVGTFHCCDSSLKVGCSLADWSHRSKVPGGSRVWNPNKRTWLRGRMLFTLTFKETEKWTWFGVLKSRIGLRPLLKLTPSPSFMKSFLQMWAIMPVAKASPITFTMVRNLSLYNRKRICERIKLNYIFAKS